MEIIAEIGQNHNGEISKARELIHAVKEAGAEVAKFQLFDMSFWEKIYRVYFVYLINFICYC